MAEQPVVAVNFPGIEHIKQYWCWLFALGILTVITGFIATSSAFVTAFAAIYFLGALLLVSGIFQIIGAVSWRMYGGFWLHLLSGILNIVFGELIIAHPVVSLQALVIILAAYFFVSGLFRIVAAVSLRLPAWEWTAFSGIIEILLAAMLLSGGTVADLWFFGFCLGVALMFQGFSWVTLAFILKKA